VLIADEAIFFGDYERAITGKSSCIRHFNDPEIEAGALYGIGRAIIFSKITRLPLKRLTTLIEQYPDSRYLANAHFIRGECYYDRANISLQRKNTRNMSNSTRCIGLFYARDSGNALMAGGDSAASAWKPTNLQ
jgi:hypothetical protein